MKARAMHYQAGKNILISKKMAVKMNQMMAMVATLLVTNMVMALSNTYTEPASAPSPGDPAFAPVPGETPYYNRCLQYFFNRYLDNCKTDPSSMLFCPKDYIAYIKECCITSKTYEQCYDHEYGGCMMYWFYTGIGSEEECIKYAKRFCGTFN